MRSDQELLEEILEEKRKEELREQLEREEFDAWQKWLQTEAGKRYLEIRLRNSRSEYPYYYEEQRDLGNYLA